jgi:hypothetical protein
VYFVQEMAKHIDARKVIIISSVKVIWNSRRMKTKTTKAYKLSDEFDIEFGEFMQSFPWGKD